MWRTARAVADDRKNAIEIALFAKRKCVATIREEKPEKGTENGSA